MREVKFRAKVLNTNNWIYRQPFHIRGTWYMYNSLWDKVPIEHKTIGQYTGLKDKKGKPIFEGDVLNCRTQIIKTMEWLESHEIVEDIRQVYDLINYEELEVIGNIFDNPELLEELS